MKKIKSYLITDPSYYNSFEEFCFYLETIYRTYHVDYACFRDKNSNKNLEKFALEFLKISQKHNVCKTLINTHIDLALKFDFWGIHLNSTQFDMISYVNEHNLATIVSTHSIKEALKAEKKGAYAITFSPIFKTSNKPKPKGVDALKQLRDVLSIKCFALGGIISQKEINECKKINIYGFASIRYFYGTIRDTKLTKDKID